MSEYTEVKQPFLHQLRSLGWQIIDQETNIPADPAKSLRLSFRQWILPEVFAKAVSAINSTTDGQPWLTERQIRISRTRSCANPIAPCWRPTRRFKSCC